MAEHTFDERKRRLRIRAKFRWYGLLTHAGVPTNLLNRSRQRCPNGCVGTGARESFFYSDKFGYGSYRCDVCGRGEGLELLCAVSGLAPESALQLLERCLSTDGHSRPVRLLDYAPQLETMLRGSIPVTVGDTVDRYLRACGVGMSVYPDSLRCHISLPYFEHRNGTSSMVARFPAMLAVVTNRTGYITGVHRTYLSGTSLAPVPRPRRGIGAENDGSAVRFGRIAGDAISIAGTVEDALAVLVHHHKPVWAAITPCNMEKLWIPESVKRLDIYGDSASGPGYAGQSAAYGLALRFMRKSRVDMARHADVFIRGSEGSSLPACRTAPQLKLVA